MRLDDYLRENGFTEADFGASVGLSQSQVNRLRNGGKTSWETAVKIVQKTDGVVGLADLGFSFEVAEAVQ